MSDSDRKFVISGKFGAPHGIKGWIKVYPETDPVDALLNYQPWHISNRRDWQPIELTGSRREKDYLVVSLQGITDRDQAKAFTGKNIAILREQLPALPDDEFYWTDLEGMTVITEDGVTLGKVDHLFSTGSNDVIVVKGDKKHLIPFLRDSFVKEISRDEKRIIVDWDPAF